MMMKKEETRNFLGTIVLVFKESLRSFVKNNDFEMSAALSSYGFFSLIPLLFFVMYVFGHFATTSQAAMRSIEALTGHMFPELDKIIMKEVQFLTKYRSTWGFISLLLLLVSVIPFADTLRTAFAKILRSDSRTPFLHAQVQNIVGVWVILLCSAALVLFEMFYSTFVLPILGSQLFILTVIDIAVSIAIVILLIVVFYLTFLPEKVGTRYLFAGALVTAVFLILLRQVFSWFLALNPAYGEVFGSLKTIFVTTGWVYCSFLVILFGAELMVNMGKKDALLLKGLFLGRLSHRRGSRRLIEKFIRVCEPDEVIVREGEKGNNMFYILSGSVRIMKKDQVLRVLGEGEYFGEMSMLLEAPRTATVIADQPGAQLVNISRHNFQVILRENPKIVISILREMADRLRITGEQLS
jgi:membrane protein